MKVIDGDSEVEAVNNVCMLIYEVMNKWIVTKMTQDIAKENNDATNLNKNWVVRKIIIGVKKKRVELFIRAKTRVRFYKLKSKVWEKCVEEGLHATVKNKKK